MENIRFLNHKVDLDQELHLSFDDIQQHTQGRFPDTEAQKAGHHIINCPRCEAIWKQLMMNRKQPLVPQSRFWKRLRAIVRRPVVGCHGT